MLHMRIQPGWSSHVTYVKGSKLPASPNSPRATATEGRSPSTAAGVDHIQLAHITATFTTIAHVPVCVFLAAISDVLVAVTIPGRSTTCKQKDQSLAGIYPEQGHSSHWLAP
jgi:hypothetical protein